MARLLILSCAALVAFALTAPEGTYTRETYPKELKPVVAAVKTVTTQAAEKVAAKPAPKPVCNMEAKLECIRNRKTLDADCNKPSNCTRATDDAAIEVVKGERCWVDGRRSCVLNIFDEESPIDNCFGSIAC